MLWQDINMDVCVRLIEFINAGQIFAWASECWEVVLGRGHFKTKRVHYIMKKDMKPKQLTYNPVYETKKLATLTFCSNRWCCTQWGKRTMLRYKNIICSFSFFTQNVHIGRVRESQRWLKCTQNRGNGAVFLWNPSAFLLHSKSFLVYMIF